MPTSEHPGGNVGQLTQTELQNLKDDMQNSLRWMQRRSFLEEMAKRYIWWKQVEEAVVDPDRVLAQVMNIGDFDDAVEMIELFEEERLRQVIRSAEAGWLNARSWSYWHYRLGMAEVDQVPPMPVRRFG